MLSPSDAETLRTGLIHLPNGDLSSEPRNDFAPMTENIPVIGVLRGRKDNLFASLWHSVG